jgi:hypothetical protein
MSIDRIKEFTGRKPFRPFTISLLDGEQILIDEATFLVIPPRSKFDTLIAFTEDGRMHIFEQSTIASLTQES